MESSIVLSHEYHNCVSVFVSVWVCMCCVVCILGAIFKWQAFRVDIVLMDFKLTSSIPYSHTQTRISSYFALSISSLSFSSPHFPSLHLSCSHVFHMRCAISNSLSSVMHKFHFASSETTNILLIFVFERRLWHKATWQGFLTQTRIDNTIPVGIARNKHYHYKTSSAAS